MSVQKPLEKDEYVLILEDIWKRFPGVVALKGVSLSVKRGEILGLVGENGAGKSTLLKIVFGIYKPDKGRIIWKGREVSVENPIHALNMGIFYVPQELLLPTNMSVAEAIAIGVEFNRSWQFVKYRDIENRAREILSKLGLGDLNPKTKIRDLTTAEKQLVLIARALAMKAELLIFDEPTSSLSISETHKFLNLMLELKKSFITQIFVSHRIEEVLSVADRIIVLRDGYKVAEFDNTEKKVTLDEVIKAMIARDIKEFYPKVKVELGDIVLEVQNLETENLHDISFTVRRGEILGIFGLLGSGIYDLPKAIVGLQRRIRGKIILEGREIRIANPTEAIKKYGILYVPEDRRNLGLFSILPVRHNVTISSLDLLAIDKILNTINMVKESSMVSKLIKALNIIPPDPSRKVAYLSGGNQQKVLISRAFSRPLRVVLLSEPTVGIDVGAKVEVRRLMVNMAKQGFGVVLISSDYNEILGMSDRVIILSKGRKVAEFQREEATPDLLLKYASR
jgi:ABC-type sugar transport system, ATPase component|uniref:Sugar ABC transporter ATP-binding protein n=1 Tax=Ignisphaera aggregans TaxID=334771 RepID=A0A7C5UVD1_9CREN